MFLPCIIDVFGVLAPNGSGHGRTVLDVPGNTRQWTGATDAVT